MLLPELTQRVDALPTLPLLAAEAQRMRLFEALGRALVGLARTRPLLVVLEDLHWASQSTFDALGFLATRALGERTLFLVSFRDDEVHALHPLRRLQREAEVEGSASSISVLPLDRDAVSEILQRPAARGSEGLADSAALHERSGGNPLFLTQFLASPTPRDEGPPTIASLVQSRVATLSPAAQTVAEIAALAGQRFSAQVVQDVAGFSDATASGALDELLDRRIVQETTGRSILPYTFAHQLVQHAIAQLADEGRIAERSRRMARALQRFYPERSREFAEQIARLLETAQRPDEAAAQYALAGQYATDVGALDDALRLVDRGLTLACNRSAVATLLQVRLMVNERLSDATAEAVDLDALTAIAEETGNDELHCTVLIRRTRIAADHLLGEDAAPLAELRERAARLGSSWQACADFMESLFHATHRNIDQAMLLAERALERYRPIGDDVGVARTLALLSRHLYVSGKTDEARRATREALSLADATGDYEAALRATLNATGNAMDSSDCDGAAEMVQRWLDLASRAGDRRNEAQALGHSTWPIMWSPDFLRALPILERAAAICREWGLHRSLSTIEANAACFFVKLGSFETAAPVYERIAEGYSESAPLYAARYRSDLAFVLAYSGQLPRAMELWQKAVGVIKSTGNVVECAVALENLAEGEYRNADISGAIGHLEEALEMRSATSSRVAMSHEGALLAAFYAETADFARALAYAKRIPADKKTLSVGVYWPQRSAWCAASAYHTCGDDGAANEWLRRAVGLYEAHLPHLSEEQRAIFAALPWHRAMLATSAGDLAHARLVVE
jgi:tetratricopeptide (TPR) repeat protein